MSRLSGERGAILILLIPTVLVFFAVLVFMINYGQAVIYGHRAQILGEVSVLSSLSLKAKSLEKIAEEAHQFGDVFVEGNAEGAKVPTAFWEKLKKNSQQLKNALPGHKGRLTSVLKVVLEANGYKRESLNVLSPLSSTLDITPQNLWVEDETGKRQRFDSLWYRRDWAIDQRLGKPANLAIHSVTLSYPLVRFMFLKPEASIWQLTRTAQGKLNWDVDHTMPLIQNQGNGGFPRTWKEALIGHEVNPYRYPYYKAELTSGLSSYE